ncbi:MAG: rhomboid family intramembrane serine protease [Erysipelotrichaceae bacterium]|nr:rhomboid family intramembrane serine protease [Erysipelotrichaceae bacterium]
MIIILIAINVLVFYFLMGGKVRLKNLAQSYQTVIKDRQYYRLLSASFTHKSLTHIFFNMLALYYVGRTVEIVYGEVGFLVIYFGSIFIGQIMSLYIHHANGQDDLLRVGASGGICGLIGAYLVAIITIFGIRNSMMNLALTLFYVIAMSVSPKVDGTSHICCFAIGLAVSYLLVLLR